MLYLAMTLVFAFALQWLVTMPPVYRFLRSSLGEQWWQNKQEKMGKEIFRILRPFLLALVGVAATQVNSALDALFARTADPEGPAYLWYALRLQQLPLALFGVGLTGALLPPMARAPEAKDHAKYRQFLSLALRQTVIYMIPITAAILSLGFISVNLVYGRGAFQPSAIVATTPCLWAYGAGLVPLSPPFSDPDGPLFFSNSSIYLRFCTPSESSEASSTPSKSQNIKNPYYKVLFLI